MSTVSGFVENVRFKNKPLKKGFAISFQVRVINNRIMGSDVTHLVFEENTKTQIAFAVWGGEGK